MSQRESRQTSAVSGRKFLAPEAIQTSSMDCGPATLKSLLSGFGIKASYGRLREACHTSVDGTSIDTLEDLTNALGLRADQEMMPVEQVLSSKAECLPALVVTRLPSGLTHFVVVWRTVGSWVQIMDPGRGRRWMKRAALERELYVHESEVDASDVKEWLNSPAFLQPLRFRMEGILGRVEAKSVLDAALSGGWTRVAAVDATLRATVRMLDQGAMGPARAQEVFRLLLASTSGPPDGQKQDSLIPDELWTVREPSSSDRGDSKTVVRGAVVLKVTGKGETSSDLPVELSAAMRADEVGPGRHLLQLLRQDGLWRALPLLAGLALAGLGSVVEVLLFRSAFDIGQRLAVFEQRLFAAVVLLVFLAALSLVEWPVARGLWDAGRRLEIRLRRAFLHKLPRLGDRYFQSRPISNMAESSHLLHWVRLLPGHGGQIVRCLCELCATVAGVIWLHPPLAPLVLVLALSVVVLPLLSQPILLEKDLRMRGHSGGLARFYLDALLGLSAIRAHTAEGAVAADHGSRLREWARAARDVARTQIVSETLLGLVGFGLAALAVFHYLVTAEGSGWAILLVYWVLMVPSLGLELSFLIQQYPQHRNVTLRLLEPLGAEEGASDEESEAVAVIDSAGAPAIRFQDVCVQQAGNQVLAVGALSIAPREHVAIVGVSGAGKSSLVGLLLGWYQPNTGVVLVDEAPLVGGVLSRLRQRTTWVDPTVQLWNRSLLENLRYGQEGERRPVGEAVEAAELDEVLARLPMGLQTPVGASGALLSGGEGQRVRLGRGICRESPRLVILDEAFCGLERVRRSAMLQSARVRWKDATLLCITHDIGQTRSFSRVLVIEGGRIVEDGVPEILAAKSGSRYAGLLAAEEHALARLAGPEWRRLRVEGGFVQEGGRLGGR